MESVLPDAAGHRRSAATLAGYHRGRAPRNAGEQYPADPPTVEEIVTVMRTIAEWVRSGRWFPRAKQQSDALRKG